MAGVTVSADWSYRGIRTLILENELLHVILMPELGAKIWQITYKPKLKNFLWHHPRLKPRLLPFHSVYDDVFYGGWDELYPNDLAEELNGEKMPDHGELWTLPWDFDITARSENEVTIHLWVDTPVTASRMEKWITLKTGEPRLHFRHKLWNRGQSDQPFLWKLHAAMTIDEHSRIDLGAKSMYIEDFGPPRNGDTGVSYEWPYITDAHGKRHDMRAALPVTSKVNEFQYATEMNEGWCAVTDTKRQVGIGLVFDPLIFRSCWTFATYGGWRDLHTVILEPCTGYPISVHDGVRQGTHQVLSSGKTIETCVTAVVYDGFSAVSSIDPEGAVR